MAGYFVASCDLRSSLLSVCLFICTLWHHTFAQQLAIYEDTAANLVLNSIDSGHGIYTAVNGVKSVVIDDGRGNTNISNTLYTPNLVVSGNVSLPTSFYKNITNAAYTSYNSAEILSRAPAIANATAVNGPIIPPGWNASYSAFGGQTLLIDASVTAYLSVSASPGNYNVTLLIDGVPVDSTSYYFTNPGTPVALPSILHTHSAVTAGNHTIALSIPFGLVVDQNCIASIRVEEIGLATNFIQQLSGYKSTEVFQSAAASNTVVSGPIIPSGWSTSYTAVGTPTIQISGSLSCYVNPGYNPGLYTIGFLIDGVQLDSTTFYFYQVGVPTTVPALVHSQTGLSIGVHNISVQIPTGLSVDQNSFLTLVVTEIGQPGVLTTQSVAPGSAVTITSSTNSSLTLFSVNGTSNAVTTALSTLDDGAGNTKVAGTLSFGKMSGVASALTPVIKFPYTGTYQDSWGNFNVNASYNVWRVNSFGNSLLNVAGSGVVSTANSVMDDGKGNMQVAGTLTLGKGSNYNGVNGTSPTGYATLPGGLIMQWTFLQFPVGSYGGSIANWTFPTPFVNKPFSCQASGDPCPGCAANSIAYYIGSPSGTTYSNTQVSVTMKSSVYTSTSALSSTTSVYILCFGL